MERAAKSGRPAATLRGAVEKPGSLLAHSQDGSALPQRAEDAGAKSAKLQSAQTGQNPVSSPTEKSGKALVRRNKSKKRKEYLKSLEADAQAVVKGFQRAKTINDQAIVLHRKFKAVVVEMRPVFERVRYGFAHLRKGETVMGEQTGTAWANKHLGVTYDWLCRCLNPPKADPLLLTDGTKVVAPSSAKSDHSHEGKETPQPKLTQKLTTIPTTDTADWTDNIYVKTCVDFIESTLRSLESDPQRFHQVAVAIAQEILGDMGNEHSTDMQQSCLAAVSE